MKNKIHKFLAFLFSLLLVSTTTHAQLVADGATAVLNGVFDSLPGGVNLIVGTNGPNTTLIMTNGGGVQTDNVFCGHTAPSTNNLIVVTGVGSRLLTLGATSVLRIGNGSAFNRLLVANGGGVAGGYGVIGYPVAATNNFVLVSDNGSSWSNNVLYVGENGSGNALTIANAGRVVANSSSIGVVAGATNNLVLVSGSNALWNTANTINVGDAGGGSQLRVVNAGTVTGTGLVLGNQTTSGNNFLSVAGTNSALNVTNSSASAMLDVRRGSAEFNGGLIMADRLVLTNGAGGFTFNDGKLITRAAFIRNGQNFVVGANAGTGPAGTNFANTTFNSIPVSGTIGPAAIYPSVINVANLGGPITKVTVTLSNLSHTFPADLDIMLVSPAGQKVMLMSDAGGGNPGVSSVNLTFDDLAAFAVPAINPLTGTYRPTDTAPGDLFPYPMPIGPYSTNLSDFNGSSPNGRWSLFIVDDGNGDSGGLGAWSLKITTATPAATWDVRSNAFPTVLSNGLYIGSGATNSTLLVTNGAILSGTFATVGNNGSDNNNRAVIAGAGSLWTNSTLSIGGAGSVNSLFITNSGRVANSDGYIGGGDFLDPSLGNNNLVTVSDPNSVWLMSGDLNIGYDGSFNTLQILNGGSVMDGSGYIGRGLSFNSLMGRYNQVTVSGANSMWVNTASLFVGYDGSFNALSITSSGTVKAANTIVGVNSGSSGNFLTVASGTLTVTNAAKNAMLDVRRGTAVFTGGNITADQLVLTNGGSSVFIFNGGKLVTRTASINNGQTFAVGADTGSDPATWDVRSNAMPTTVANDFYVGSNAPNSTLLLTNGGTLAVSGSSYLGYNPSSSNNLILIAGPNSFWTNSGSTFLGYSGSGNTMLITNGGTVANGLDSTLGYGFSGGGNNNHATVSDAGSSWSLGGGLSVGASSSFNTLLIANGGQVAGNGALIGNASGANSNAVTVTGSGSQWVSSDTLLIGEAGSFNSLLIANGGHVYNQGGSIGNSSGANGNRVLVTDSDSQWINVNSLFVGRDGFGNSLVVSNGAWVLVPNGIMTIGKNSGANSNQVVVTGANSALQCTSFSLSFGDGSFNTLLITNGGAVQANGVNLNSGTEGGNLLTVANGTLDAGAGTLQINGGSLMFNGGFINALQLKLNGGTFTFNSGNFNIRHAIEDNGVPFTVGDGTSTATYFMSGNTFDTHFILNGLIITNNATLSGNGTILGLGGVTIAAGGTLSPGASIGTVILEGTPTLHGKIIMEITKNGGIVTNDVLIVSNVMTLGGSLVVTNIGPDALAAGDSFQLFSTIGPISGAFSPLVLPSLPSGLSWTNKLLVDGSIAVVNSAALNISNFMLSGTNLIFTVTGGLPGNPWNLLTTTNVVLPLSVWTTNQSGFFDSFGNVILSNGIDFTEPLRFFNISAP